MPSNDNHSEAFSATADSHGRAALLLVESLIHGLCENGTLVVRDAVAIARRAAEVQDEQAEAADGAGTVMREAYAHLALIGDSLSADLGPFDRV